MNEEPETIYSATLIVLGDDLIPEKVTEQLGLEPNLYWRKGERKSFVRHDGAIHYFDSVYKPGGWKCFIPEDKEGAELAEQLEWWCDRLEGHEPALRELEAQGCWLEMDCFVGSRQSAIIEVNAAQDLLSSSLQINAD